MPKLCAIVILSQRKSRDLNVEGIVIFFACRQVFFQGERSKGLSLEFTRLGKHNCEQGRKHGSFFPRFISVVFLFFFAPKFLAFVERVSSLENRQFSKNDTDEEGNIRTIEVRNSGEIYQAP